MESGRIFGLKDFAEFKNPQAVMLELVRLNKKEIIQRLSKGKYFVPRKSRFGTLKPDEWQILSTIIQDNGGYFAGLTALHRLGVTTQVPSVVTIRGARSTRKLKIGNLTVNLVRMGNADATAQQSNLTDMIEAIRLIKKTPDGTISKTLSAVSRSLKARTAEEIGQLLHLLKNERPYVRAVFGALMEHLGIEQGQTLMQNLNPITKYRVGISSNSLPNKDKWGII